MANQTVLENEISGYKREIQKLAKRIEAQEELIAFHWDDRELKGDLARQLAALQTTKLMYMAKVIHLEGPNGKLSSHKDKY